MFHCMLDLETLGTRPGDVVLSIGAVLFQPDKGIVSEFYCAISPDDSKLMGFKAQKSTLEWWSKQSPEAQAQAFAGTESVYAALTKFRMWFPPPKNCLIYGNGADFDLPLLAALYRHTKQEVPWSPWSGRCYRTLKNLAPELKIVRQGTYHNALDDAKSQAEHLLAVVEHTGIVLG